MIEKAFYRTCASITVLLLAAGSAFAAESGHDNLVEQVAHDAENLVDHVEGVLEHGAEAAHHVSKGLPQMDASTFPSQIFWLTVTFIFLYLIFSRKILPDIAGTLENRRSQIQEDLNSAKELKNEAQEVQTSYEAALERSHQEARQAYKEVEEEIQEKTAKRSAEFHEQSKRDLAEAEKDVLAAKDKARDEMSAIAAEIARDVAEKVIGVKTDIKVAQSIVDGLQKKQTKKAA